jgi:caspase domain-containing protein
MLTNRSITKFLLIIFSLFFLFLAQVYGKNKGDQLSGKRGLGVTERDDSGVRNIQGPGINRALLIGNNNYQTRKWPDLKTAILDVEGLGKILVKRYGFHPENVTIRRDANRRDILTSFDLIADQAGPEDQVLIFYAGHGEFDKREQGYWIPVDGSDTYNYISNGEILDKIRIIKAKHKFLISDSCFSGNLFTRTRSRQEVITKDRKLRSGYFLEKSRLASVQGLSSGGDEPVSDGGLRWEGHSIFAYHLLAVLEANRQRYLSASLLGVKLSENVANDTATYSGIGKGQTPILSPIKNQGSQGGEFFFVPVDLGKLKITPVVVFFDKVDDNDAIAKQKHTRETVQKAIHKLIKEYDLTVKATQQLTSDDKVSEITESLKKHEAEGALVIKLSGSIKKKVTMMYQGLGYLTVGFEVYQLDAGGLDQLSETKLKPQVTTIRKWNDNPDKMRKHFQILVEKTVSKWSGQTRHADTSYQIQQVIAQLESE